LYSGAAGWYYDADRKTLWAVVFAEEKKEQAVMARNGIASLPVLARPAPGQVRVSVRPKE
jgi:hypothetical protein